MILGVIAYECIFHAITARSDFRFTRVGLFLCHGIFDMAGITIGYSLGKAAEECWLSRRAIPIDYDSESSVDFYAASVVSRESILELVEACGGDDSVLEARDSGQYPDLENIPVCPISQYLPHNPMQDTQIPQMDDIDNRHLQQWFHTRRGRIHPITGEPISADRFQHDQEQYNNTKEALGKLAFDRNYAP